MSRFDDQYRFSDQDRGYRSDEVRGPTREAWADQQPQKRAEPEETPGSAGGYGNSRNPAWAGQSASLESDVAGRGSYGANGAEGTLGYGRYEEGGEGRVPSSGVERHGSGREGSNRGDRDREPRQSSPQHPRQQQQTHRHFGREGGGGYGVYDIGGKGAQGYYRVANENYDDMIHDEPRRTTRPSTSAPAGEAYGTRHWGHGEYRGNDDASAPTSKRAGGIFERAEKLGERVGKFFGVGPKGYRRSDERIHEDVCETLQNHHEIDASEIEVTVASGVVKLTGTVDERRTRRLVEDLIDHLPGIQELENHLRTKSYVARTEAADQLKLGEAQPSTDAERPTLHS